MIARFTKLLKKPFFLVFLLFLLTAKGHLAVIDSEYSVRSAISILEEHSLLIDLVDPSTLEILPDIEGTDKIYSQYGIGLIAIFFPFVCLGKLFSLITGLDQRIIIDFLLSFYNIPFALLGLFFYRSILIRLGTSAPKANAICLLMAISTAYWKYTVTDFSEITQISLLLGSINAILSKESSKWRMVSFWSALLVSIKLVYIILLPIFLLYLIFEIIPKKDLRHGFKKCIDFSIFLVPVGIILAYANFVRFGDFMETGYGSQGSAFSLIFAQRDWFDYLFSLQRGIFPFNPILFIAIGGWFFIQKDHRKFMTFLFAIIFIWFLAMCFWKSLQGGYCWGNRLLVPIIPLLLLPLSFIPFKTKSIRLLSGLTAIISIFFQLSAAMTKTHECSVLRNEIYSKTGFLTPSQLPSTLIVFMHKVTDGSTHYRPSVLGIDSEKSIDLSDFDSFHGLNVWPVHALNFMNYRQYCRITSFLMLGVVLILIYKICTQIKTYSINFKN